MLKKINFTNRHKDVFTFSVTEEGNILMEGSFKHMRVGCPNIYDDAYAAYKANTEENESLPLEDFKKEIHRGQIKDETYVVSDLYSKYGRFIYPDNMTLSMIDPSGGPFLMQGSDMGIVNKSFRGMFVEKIVSTEKGYLIIIKK